VTRGELALQAVFASRLSAFILVLALQAVFARRLASFILVTSRRTQLARVASHRGLHLVGTSTLSSVTISARIGFRLRSGNPSSSDFKLVLSAELLHNIS
jgi:hypothetical protein